MKNKAKVDVLSKHREHDEVNMPSRKMDPDMGLNRRQRSKTQDHNCFQTAGEITRPAATLWGRGAKWACTFVKNEEKLPYSRRFLALLNR